MQIVDDQNQVHPQGHENDMSYCIQSNSPLLVLLLLFLKV